MHTLWRLHKKALRFSEFKKSMPHISDRMLSKVLNELIADNLITKKGSTESVTRTEYAIDKRGLESIKIIDVLRKYGTDLMKEEGVI
jgi:DNA-binding HxlR family transcriptional regulator